MGPTAIDAIDVTDPDTRSRMWLTLAFACALAGAATIGQPIAQIWQFINESSFKEWVGQLAQSIGMVVGILGVIGTISVLCAHRPDHDTRRVRVAAICLAVVTGTAVVIAVLGVWSTLALRLSTPTNLNETFSFGTATGQYPMSFVVGGVLHGIATLALLIPALNYLLRYLRGTAARSAATDDIEHDGLA